MDPSEWEQTLFMLILHAGEARSKAKEAAEFAKEGDWVNAQRLMEEAEDEQLEAHKVSAKIVKMEAGGEQVDFSVLLVHALDLLILAWIEIDHVYETIDMRKRLKTLEDEVSQWKNRELRS
ncbi:MAG TPA: PTS lactose/cellobiose transporter subunit IIA [Anaerolineae bacterium]|nr:PTS lactose/cellobiose transporter subunit IIA [Anaerolineae bacterium]